MFAILLEDLAALVGLVIALIGIFFGHLLNNLYFDGAASAAIGVLLVGMAIFMLGEAKGLLLGEGASDAVLSDLQQLVGQDPAVERLRPPLSMYLGPTDAILALDVSFKDQLTAAEIEQAVDRLQTVIKAQHPDFKRIFIEASALKQHQSGPATPA